MVSRVAVAIVGAGPYGLSLAAHLAERKVEHRIFGRPMQFWSDIADAGGERYLKSYCFGTNLSAPKSGYSFADYNAARGLETFEPCSIPNFVDYGGWFQRGNVPWVEMADVVCLEQQEQGFLLTLADGERCYAEHVVIATGLTGYAYVPPVLASLPQSLATHSSEISSFSAFRGRDVAVIGAGQSALEAAALLHEAGARPQLVVRKESILWQTQVMLKRSLWRRVRSPISGLGTGPKAWALTRFPGALHRVSDKWRVHFVKNHLPPEGAWWLRERVEGRLPIHCRTMVVGAREDNGRVKLELHSAIGKCRHQLSFDHVIGGTGYDINVDRLGFIHRKLRCAVDRINGAPKLSASFETSVPGLHFVGPASAMSFGPLFRFVVGAQYSVGVLSAHFARQAL